MGLDLEYFKKQMHINDLQNLNENELKFIIRLLEDELEEFNINDGLESKELIKACHNAFIVFKDFRYILYGYKLIIRKYNLSFCDNTYTEQLITNMDAIIDNLKYINVIKASKEKLNDQVDTVILNIRVFYDMMNDYINEEYDIWEAENCRQEKLNSRRQG